jgi:5'/3'-nucleotidase SurE
MEYGISKVAPRLWSNQAPEFAVAGPNVGSNVWGSVYFSGTVGATVHAVRQHKIPAIAFSGTSDERASFETKPTPTRSLVYAELATELTNVILESGKPYLPANVWLNVNFPKVEGACTKASDFKWVMTRINPPIPIIHWDEDTEICGSKNLPTEFDVMNRNDCYIAVTAGDALDKTTGSAEQQELVYQKLKSILTCLPK